MFIRLPEAETQHGGKTQFSLPAGPEVQQSYVETGR